MNIKATFLVTLLLMSAGTLSASDHKAKLIEIACKAVEAERYYIDGKCEDEMGISSRDEDDEWVLSAFLTGGDCLVYVVIGRKDLSIHELYSRCAE